MRTGKQQARANDLLRAFAQLALVESDFASLPKCASKAHKKALIYKRKAAHEALELLDPPAKLFGPVDPEPLVYDITTAFQLRLTNVMSRCTQCRALFGVQLRRMGNGQVRNQSTCQPCRSGVGAPVME